MVSRTLSYVFYLYFALPLATPATEGVAENSAQMKYAHIGWLSTYRAHYLYFFASFLLHTSVRYVANIKSILQQSDMKLSLCCNFISNFVPYGSQEVNR